MRIIVNGKKAVIKKDLAFEYVRENPLFTDAEDYSMDIVFPLDDCPQNVDIFGALHVKSVDIRTISFPCELISGEFYRAGILTIVSVTDSYVKGQFLEGMSAQNFKADLDSTYLTDLDFSQWDGTRGGWENFPDGDYATGRSAGWIEFPVYDSNKERVIEAVNQGDGRDYYSRHIYLWKLVSLVASATGWKVNQSCLTRISMYMHVVVVNTRNFIWNDSGDTIRPLALSLPRWTVKQFYEEVSKFFGCLVDINKDKHQVTFKSYTDVATNATKINLDVLDDFTIEVNTKEDPKYRGARKYKLSDEANPKNINSCSFIQSDLRIPHVNNMTKSEFLSQIAGLAAHSHDERDDLSYYLYHLVDTGQWAAVVDQDDSIKTGTIWVGGNVGGHEERVENDYPTMICQEAEILNQFGDIPEDGEDLKICPCPCEGPFWKFHYGWNASFVPAMEEFRYKRIPSMDIPDDPEECYDSDAPQHAPAVRELLSSGERKSEDLYFDKLWVVLWRGTSDVAGGAEYWSTKKEEPYAQIKKAEYWSRTGGWVAIKDENDDFIYKYYTAGFLNAVWNLAPNESALQANAALPKVDESKLYKYKFLSRTLPDPKAIYIIKGKQYACSKLTAHFTVKGMSELINGEFYEIID